MERESIGDNKTLTRWPCTLAEVERAMDGVSQWFHFNPLSLQCHDIFLCNICCRYSLLNGIIDSQKVRA
jgi:hypothetical protein